MFINNALLFINSLLDFCKEFIIIYSLKTMHLSIHIKINKFKKILTIYLFLVERYQYTEE
jgi:hypothetical protein